MNHRDTEDTENTAEEEAKAPALSDLCASVSLWLRFGLLPPEY